MNNNKSLLLVEGASEKYVISQLCPLCGFNLEKCKIKSEDSITSLKNALKTLIKSTNEYNKIWVIIDADTNFDSAWQSIRDILIRSNVAYSSINNRTPIPDNGIIVHPDDPNNIIIGVWIMPNNTDIGMLEDFLMSLITDDNSLYQEAKEIVKKIELNRKTHFNLYKMVHKSKATIHTWLAWQNEPGVSLSTAVNKRFFDTNKELCVKFTEWLKELQQ